MGSFFIYIIFIFFSSINLLVYLSVGDKFKTLLYRSCHNLCLSSPKGNTWTCY